MAIFGNDKTRADEVERLRRAVEELSVLNDLARAISVSQDSDEIMKTIIGRSVKAVSAEEASITMVDRDEMVPTGTLIWERTSGGGDEHYHLNRNVLGFMCHEKRSLLVNDPAADPRFQGIRIAEGIRNFMCVPLMVGAELIGILSAYNKIGEEFNQDDQRILAIIATQSAQVLEKTRLDQEAKASERIREDMRLAEIIQEKLLPNGPPDIPGFDVAGASLAAGHVGGDYFDFIPLRDNRWAIALGDVSGKGVPAALLMANLQATLRSQALQDTSCHQCMANCNRLLFLSTSHDRFATLFYGRLDIRSNVLTYCNAGHERPFHLTRDGETKRLVAGGLAVGILEEFDYEDDIVILQPGELVVVFSDGVTDMINNEDEAFGEGRLEDLLGNNLGLEARDLVELIIAEVKKHAGDEPAFDDVTVVIIKKNP
ncbi:MAG: GAF domain-containing SpoIIE family protein phosphatase [Candidatus Krumholzibacteriota bacterium]